MGLNERFVGWTEHFQQRHREGETFNRNGSGLKGFGGTRGKLVGGNSLAPKDSLASVRRAVRVVGHIGRIAGHPEVRPTCEVCLTKKRHVNSSVVE